MFNDGLGPGVVYNMICSSSVHCTIWCTLRAIIIFISSTFLVNSVNLYFYMFKSKICQLFVQFHPVILFINNITMMTSSLKALVKKVVWQHETECWISPKYLYPELDIFYKSINVIRMNCWWRSAASYPHQTKKISGLIAVLMGSELKHLQCQFTTKVCGLCCRSRKMEQFAYFSNVPS